MSKKYPGAVKSYKRYSGSLVVDIAWRSGMYLINVLRKRPSAGEHFDIAGPSPYDMTVARRSTNLDVVAAQAIASSRLRPDADRDGPVNDWRSYIIRRRK